MLVANLYSCMQTEGLEGMLGCRPAGKCQSGADLQHDSDYPGHGALPFAEPSPVL